MATISARAWAALALCGFAATGCSTTSPFAKSPPKNDAAIAKNSSGEKDKEKGGWNRNDGKSLTANNPALPPPTPTNNSNNVTTVSTNGANSSATPANNPGGPLKPLPGEVQLLNHTTQSAPPSAPAPSSPTILNLQGSTPPSPGVTSNGMKLPDGVATRSSMPMPAGLSEPPGGSGMPLPAAAPPVNDLPAPPPPLPTPSAMPAPSPMPPAQGMPTPANGLPSPVQLPPIKARPKTD